MNRSGLVFLVIAVLIAIISIGLNTFINNNKSFQVLNTDKKIDFYLSDFTLLNTQENGLLRYKISGNNLIHQQTKGTSELTNISLKAQNTMGDITTLMAAKAVQNTQENIIKLIGKVSIEKEISLSSDLLHIKTSNLIYNPLRKTLHSNDKISLQSDAQGSGKMSGTGFTSNIDEQEIRIHSDVQAEFKPAN